MDPTPVTLDAATVAALAAAANGRPVPLRNPDGEVIGYYLTPAQKAQAGAVLNDRLGVPPHVRGPDPLMGAALAEIEARRATGPQFSTPINDDDLREARAGGMYGDVG